MTTTTAQQLIMQKVNEYLECGEAQERDLYFELTNVIRNSKQLVDPLAELLV